MVLPATKGSALMIFSMIFQISVLKSRFMQLNSCMDDFLIAGLKNQ